MTAMLFENCRLFTALDEQLIEAGVLLVDEGKVRYAGRASDCPAQAEQRFDCGGRFVMPGMTETHAHLSFADASPFAIGATSVEDATLTAVSNAAKMLQSGFTSAISFGSTYKIDVALREAINSGRIAGPRLLAAGRDLGATASNVDSPGGLSQIADGPWALRRAVREQRKIGVEVVQIFIDGEAINKTNPPGELSFCDEEVAAVVDEAHRRKLKVACHARSADAVKQATRAGVDYIGHANYLDNEAVDLLAARNEVYVGPAIAWEVQYVAQCESLGVSRETVRQQGYEAEIEATQVAVAMMREAGIKMVVGGDYGISIAPHGTYAKDLEYFVQLFGMSAAEALICATRYGGEAFTAGCRDTAVTDVGTLQIGAMADFLIVDGDPLTDVCVLQDHANLDVFVGGQLV